MPMSAPVTRTRLPVSLNDRSIVLVPNGSLTSTMIDMPCAGISPFAAHRHPRTHVSIPQEISTTKEASKNSV
jgi:hypothetical protein